MSSVQILVIEDEKPIADTILYALKSESYLPMWCSNGTDALMELTCKKFSLLILDVGLPDISGFELCRKIRTTSSIPIIFLTARSEEVDRIVGLEIGGDDYMVKPFSPRELVARVRAILRRIETISDSSVDKKLMDSEFLVDDHSKNISFLGTLLDLTKQEYLILSSLVEHPGRVFSREQLLEIAWEESGFCSERTVDTYMKTIRSKLNQIDNSSDRIVTHRGFGYSLRKSI
jgi:two-component system catabolic regulation response regulator CreB